jgi:hypothetical protein
LLREFQVGIPARQLPQKLFAGSLVNDLFLARFEGLLEMKALA